MKTFPSHSPNSATSPMQLALNKTEQLIDYRQCRVEMLYIGIANYVDVMTGVRETTNKAIAVFLIPQSQHIPGGAKICFALHKS